jgi:hypothetical protein
MKIFEMMIKLCMRVVCLRGFPNSPAMKPNGGREQAPWCDGAYHNLVTSWTIRSRSKCSRRGNWSCTRRRLGRRQILILELYNLQIGEESLCDEALTLSGQQYLIPDPIVRRKGHTPHGDDLTWASSRRSKVNGSSSWL